MKLLLVLLSTVFLLGQISYALPKASADEADPAGKEAKDGAVEAPADAADEGEAPAEDADEGEAPAEDADAEEASGDGEEPAAEEGTPAGGNKAAAEGELPAEEAPQDYVDPSAAAPNADGKGRRRHRRFRRRF